MCVVFCASEQHCMCPSRMEECMTKFHKEKPAEPKLDNESSARIYSDSWPFDLDDTANKVCRIRADCLYSTVLKLPIHSRPNCDVISQINCHG